MNPSDRYGVRQAGCVIQQMSNRHRLRPVGGTKDAEGFNLLNHRIVETNLTALRQLKNTFCSYHFGHGEPHVNRVLRC